MNPVPSAADSLCLSLLPICCPLVLNSAETTSTAAALATLSAVSDNEGGAEGAMKEQNHNFLLNERLLQLLHLEDDEMRCCSRLRPDSPEGLPSKIKTALL